MIIPGVCPACGQERLMAGSKQPTVRCYAPGCPAPNAASHLLSEERYRTTNKALNLLDELAVDTDQVPCRIDHDGVCQEHGWTESGFCPDADAHAFLKRQGYR